MNHEWFEIWFRTWPLNTWPKCAPPSGGGLRVSTIFVTTTRKRKLRPPQDTTMAEGAERFRGLWEDEMFARQVQNTLAAARRTRART